MGCGASAPAAAPLPGPTAARAPGTADGHGARVAPLPLPASAAGHALDAAPLNSGVAIAVSANPAPVSSLGIDDRAPAPLTATQTLPADAEPSGLGASARRADDAVVTAPARAAAVADPSTAQPADSALFLASARSPVVTARTSAPPSPSPRGAAAFALVPPAPQPPPHDADADAPRRVSDARPTLAIDVTAVGGGVSVHSPAPTAPAVASAAAAPSPRPLPPAVPTPAATLRERITALHATYAAMQQRDGGVSPSSCAAGGDSSDTGGVLSPGVAGRGGAARFFFAAGGPALPGSPRGGAPAGASDGSGAAGPPATAPPPPLLPAPVALPASLSSVGGDGASSGRSARTPHHFGPSPAAPPPDVHRFEHKLKLVVPAPADGVGGGYFTGVVDASAGASAGTSADVGSGSGGDGATARDTAGPAAAAVAAPAAASPAAPSPTPPAPSGATPRFVKVKLINQYRMGPVIGRGTFGKVRRCVDEFTGEPRAVKILRKSVLRRKRVGRMGSALDNVQREIAVWRKLSHPCVVRLIEVIDSDASDKLYLVSELVEGGCVLAGAAGGAAHPLPLPAAARYFGQLCRGLQYLHFEGVAHRDVKPQNLLLDAATDSVRITDFGLSVLVADGGDVQRSTAGTAAFLAPEMLTGAPFRAMRADVWAAGVTLFMMVFGRTPFAAPTVPALYDAIRGADIDFSQATGASEAAGVPGAAALAVDLMRRVLERDPERRATLDELLQHPFVTDAGGPGARVGAVPLPSEPISASLTDADVADAVSQVIPLRIAVRIAVAGRRHLATARDRIRRRSQGDVVDAAAAAAAAGLGGGGRSGGVPPPASGAEATTIAGAGAGAAGAGGTTSESL